MFDVNDIYAQVQEGIAKTEADSKASRGNMIWKEILSFKPGNDYVLRIVPYTKCEGEVFKRTFFTSYQFGWTAPDGKRVIACSAKTLNLPCPMDEYRKSVLRNGTEQEQDEMKKKLSFRTVHYFTVYVVNDPVTPANNGTLKIVKAGSQIWNVIQDYLSGKNDDVVEGMGKKVLDLSPNGANLVISPKVNQMGVPDYTNGVKFVTKGADLGLDDEGIKNLLDTAYDLDKVDYIRDYDDCKKFFKASFFGEGGDGIHHDQGSRPTAQTAAAPANKAAVNTEESVESFLSSLNV